MESTDLPIKIKIPKVTRDKLSFCTGNEDGISKWAKALPMANTGESARQLYFAIGELNQWQASPELRFKILEVVRPYIYSICHQLARHFIQSSLSLNAKQLKIAKLTQALISQLATGYKLVVGHAIIQSKQQNKTFKLLPIAIHRGITDISQGIVLSYQLYQQPAEHSWIELNQLFLFAEANRWLDFEIKDKQTQYLSSSSIANAFIRAHLLAAAKPNNLRQQDINFLFNTLELWSSSCKIEPAESEESLFIVNLYRDNAAMFRQHLRDNQKPLFRGINTKVLVKALRAFSTDPKTNTGVTVPKQISETLLNHVTHAWGVHAQRSFKRIPSSGQLKLCLGLMSIHYYCAQETNFEKLLIELKAKHAFAGNDYRASSINSDNAWGQAADAIENDGSLGAAMSFEFVSSEDAKAHEAAKYPIFDTEISNSSPGGYSVSWQGETPPSLQAGELLGVKEPGIQHWAIAVVRWIHRSPNQETRIGIELLSPRAEPGAAQLLHKTGENGALLRALILPEIKAIAQPASILVSHLPFKTGNKVNLLFDDLNGRFQLTKRLTSTSSFNQFQFRQLGVVHEPATQTRLSSIDDDFDMLWGKL